MPELPEVETVVRMLRPQLAGRRVAAVRMGRQRLRTPWRRSWNAHVIGRRVAEVSRRGKWIMIFLGSSTTGDCLLAHLGMTGRLYVTAKGSPRAPHTHAVFPLDGGHEELRFQDPRRFGMLCYSPSEAGLPFEAGKLGPEPWDLQPAAWRAALARARRPIKALLLDQRVLAGVGNIYADESLHEARLHPGRLASELVRSEAERLLQAVRRVLHRAIEKHGSTILSFHYGDGERGGYQHEFRVYGRTGEPCRRCGCPIVAVRLAGRTTHFCPRCQPTP
ncbi:MAG TPA: bifunctional DNA-formamidopyrimidine glycosylase/DNA-(apurinic or apyrimidinic site) lyase [Gemmatales bacterium]|nr:bifunctional DNA-formamidopyrimidine glycosylase/DNA-(apurinic or apyrimidinic site) lyase [Gemmatales bacterium]HMP58138.1 bifunctional DNA-formamidopyrimidine glycosylase/DNA-(apurinic or apyrimidinic site) lyase [Gemmatales bacterium]